MNWNGQECKKKTSWVAESCVNDKEELESLESRLWNHRPLSEILTFILGTQ